MKKYEVYKVEVGETSTGKHPKRLVLQGEGDQYPMKNVTMWEDHPLYEEIEVGQTVELDIEVKDSNTPNPKVKGGFYKNRTALKPNQAPSKQADTPHTGTSVVEVYNKINLEVMPMLRSLHKEILAISGRQERQMGLDSKAIDDAFGGEENVQSPF